MYSIILTGSACLLLVCCFVVRPVVNYFRDPKGLRRYPSVNAIAGITNLGFMWESQKGFRSKKLCEMHKVHPVVRIGPNSLSYGDVHAIKVRRSIPQCRDTTN